MKEKPYAEGVPSPFTDSPTLSAFVVRRRVLSPHATVSFVPTEPLVPERVDVPKPTPHRSLSRHLDGWVLAAFGPLAAFYVESAPPPPGTSISVTFSPQPEHVEVPQEHVAQAVNYVTSAGALPAGARLNFTPVQDKLVLHISNAVDAASDHTVDIVVQAQPQKPSEAAIKDAKDFFRQHTRTLLASLTAAVIAKSQDKALDSAWAALKDLVKKLKAKTGVIASSEANSVPGSEPANGSPPATAQTANLPAQAAPPPNPLLVWLVEPFEILVQIFNPADAASRTHPIDFIAEKLRRSQAEAEAILLRAGVFVQISPGVWGLDPHFGSADSVSDPEVLPR